MVLAYGIKIKNPSRPEAQSFAGKSGAILGRHPVTPDPIFYIQLNTSVCHIITLSFWIALKLASPQGARKFRSAVHPATLTSLHSGRQTPDPSGLQRLGESSWGRWAGRPPPQGSVASRGVLFHLR